MKQHCLKPMVITKAYRDNVVMKMTKKINHNLGVIRESNHIIWCSATALMPESSPISQPFLLFNNGQMFGNLNLFQGAVKNLWASKLQHETVKSPQYRKTIASIFQDNGFHLQLLRVMLITNPLMAGTSTFCQRSYPGHCNPVFPMLCPAQHDRNTVQMFFKPYVVRYFGWAHFSSFLSKQGLCFIMFKSPG